jgi:hypothetical protein
MAGNAVNLEFAGDATKLAQAAKRAEQSVAQVGSSATDASDDLQRASRSADQAGQSYGDLGSATTGAIDAIDSLGGGLQALADIQDSARQKAQRLAQAANDVAQAQEDMAQATRDANQATIDGEQAALDAEQARLDQATALKDYNAAVREFGAGSAEARQAQIDLTQAGIDLKQAQEDSAQATRDASQANIDARQGQLDLNEAMHEANPPELQQWADQVNMATPLLSAMVGVVGLVTAAQWAWNAAQLASPTTWIILAIGALIAIIVLIATKTDWFQRAWRASWKWIKEAAANTWDFLKRIPDWIGSVFRKVASAIASPFQSAFNAVRWAWNNTVGRLSWTVPGWVPGIGGNSISAPRLHEGGRVPGMPGQEVLTLLQGGERVSSPAGNVGGSQGEWIHVDLGDLGAALLEPIARAVQRRGGTVQALGVKVVNGVVR